MILGPGRLSDRYTQTKLILPDDHECIVHEMLRYLYTGDYEEGLHCLKTPAGDDYREHTNIEPCCFTPMLFSVSIRTIAEKYKLPDLAKLANVKFAKRASKEWKTEDFADAIEAMYAPDSDDSMDLNNKKVMQASALEVAFHHSKELYSTDLGFGNRFREVAGNSPQFASQLAAKLAGASVDATRWPLATMRVTVKRSVGNQSILEISPRDSLREMKDLIDAIEGVIPGRYHLVFNGRLIKENSKTAMDHGIHNGAVLGVIERPLDEMTIMVQTLIYKKFWVEIRPHYTIDYIKELIQDQHGTPSVDQRLIFLGKHMQDGRTAEEHGLQEGATITLCLALRGT